MSPPARVHEHVPRLVEVVFGDAGQPVREFFCASCQLSWFE
jgi:hypothetical protein